MNGAMMIPEFDHEFALTRKVLERIPEDRLDWRPHEKSWTVRELSAHLANLLKWVEITVNSDGFDMDAPQEPWVPGSKQDLLNEFDANLTSARALIAGASAETLGEIWSLRKGGEATFSMPKAAVLRSFILNHNVHHRAQLGMYLRLLDVPVPSIYGPSADETGE